MDDQYYVGDSGLLFKPVVTEGAASTDVYLADDQVSRGEAKVRVHKAERSAVLRLLFASTVSSIILLTIGFHRHAFVVFPAPTARWTHHPHPPASPAILASHVARPFHPHHRPQQGRDRQR